jgi:hypothetical protein
MSSSKESQAPVLRGSTGRPKALNRKDAKYAKGDILVPKKIEIPKSVFFFAFYAPSRFNP